MPEFRLLRIPTTLLSSSALVLTLGLGALGSADSGASFGGSSFGGGGSSPSAPSSPATPPPSRNTSPAPAVHTSTSGPKSPTPARTQDDGASTNRSNLGPIIVFGGTFGFIMLLVVKGRGRRNAAGQHYDIARYAFGVDGRLSELRARLEELATTTDMSSFTGRAAALRTICTELQRNEESVFFADVQTWAGVESSAAEREFQTRALEARSAFDRETLRVDEGGIQRQTKNIELDGELLDEDGDFFVNEVFVLTLVLATLGSEDQPATIENHDRLREALLSIGATPSSSLIALEVIWSPSADSDTMTVDEMQMTYPRLMRL